MCSSDLIAVEFTDGIVIKNVVEIPLVFHGEVVATIGTNSGEIREEITGPDVETATFLGVRTGYFPVDFCLWADVIIAFFINHFR